MLVLILGMLIWTGVHLMPSVAQPLRASVIERLGEQKYQGLFALGILTSLAFIIFGWRSTPPDPVYSVPAWGRLAAVVLVYPALVLFVASGMPSNIKRFLRHPQLAGVFVWSIGHLFANGESRSLVLFGGMGAWAIVAMLTINRRDGEWVKPEPTPVSADLKPLLIAAIAYGVLLFAHPFLSGVSAMPS
ncbi:MAG: NnrU family protein [Myxococcales bacterium]